MTEQTTGRLTQQQILRLIRAIDGSHVETKRGMSYIAQFQARAEMTRIFGFGNWDSQLEKLELRYETRLAKGDPQFPKDGAATAIYWVTGYEAWVRVRIRAYDGTPIAEFVEAHFEENAPLPNRGEAHAMGITSAESYALRRCLIALGDRLGLSLYKKGSTLPLVRGTLQLDDPESPTYFTPQQQAAAAAGTANAGAAQDEARQKIDAAFNKGDAAEETPGDFPEADDSAQ